MLRALFFQEILELGIVHFVRSFSQNCTEENTSPCAHTRSPPSRRPPAISSEKASVSFFSSSLPPFSLQRAPAILQSIFASPDRTNQNDGSGIAVDCHITLSTVPTLT
jgi:hypothetical protein